MRRYQALGFIPFESPPARVTRLADADTIIKGDILDDNGSGYATNEDNVLFAYGTCLGVAAASVDNSGASGTVGDDLSVEIYPLDFNTLWIVPVAGTAITRDAVGTYVDLETKDEIDITDVPTGGLAFFIEDIDISTEAIVANSGGYAIGRFRLIEAQAS